MTRRVEYRAGRRSRMASGCGSGVENAASPCEWTTSQSSSTMISSWSICVAAAAAAAGFPFEFGLWLQLPFRISLHLLEFKRGRKISLFGDSEKKLRHFLKLSCPAVVTISFHVPLWVHATCPHYLPSKIVFLRSTCCRSHFLSQKYLELRNNLLFN